MTMTQDYVPVKAPDPSLAAPAAPHRPTEPRQLLRRRLLLWSIPVALLVLLIAAKCLSVAIASAQSAEAYARGDAAGVHSAASVLKVVNVIEPYKAWFAEGDAFVLEGNFAAAREQFETALGMASADDSCKVRVNLVLTLEKLADQKTQSGDAAGAKSLYDAGIKVVNEAQPGCFQKNSSGNQQGEGQNLQDAKGRMENKSAGNQQGDSGQQKQGDGGSTPPPDQSKLDQLNKQQKQAQQDRGSEQQGTEPPGSGGGGAGTKQW
ncbi:hypothetical protein [Psychromicrobium xiongbiense]|uniref:hypothetical protein n=1 Tax=Psychromicrobium xiongbiense TaxID=3051184 RepID=UPI00255383F5|nr:hypothetical protein [Psychromicrobium sp. YIM S02556]